MNESKNQFKAFSIEGRLYRERERLSFGGMTKEERCFRKQWIKDQFLSKNEPVDVPELRLSTTNIFKRMVRKPLDYVFEPLKPRLGITATNVTRSIVGKLLMSVYLVYAGAYYFKYNQNDWTRKGGWRLLESRPAVLPGERFESKVKYVEPPMKPKETEAPKQEEKTTKVDTCEPDDEQKSEETEETEGQEVNPSILDEKEQETEEKTEKQNEQNIDPSYRTLGSYYASRGFENSPL